jgi:hypothetical protein
MKLLTKLISEKSRRELKRLKVWKIAIPFYYSGGKIRGTMELYKMRQNRF